MKNIQTKGFKIILIFCAFIWGFMFASNVWADGEILYTAHNIWYEVGKEQKLFCLNYKTGVILPAGTQVTNVQIKKTRAARRANPQSMALFFETVKDSRKYMVHFTAKFHPGKTIEEYKDFMFGTKGFNQIVKGLKKNEIKAIKAGQIVAGMSKKAVLIAYGHPPEHKTPSLDMNQWRYWMNRFANKAVVFDGKGRTFSNPM